MEIGHGAHQASILIEAEDFDDFGGWVLDSQFEAVMASPYLMAHGLGRPVADAKTVVRIPETGQYHVLVRAKDWVPDHHPGRFKLAINGIALAEDFGASGRDWSWEYGGVVEIAEGDAQLVLIDQTGFNGRCDAIYLSKGATWPAAGLADTEIGCFHLSEVHNAKKEVQPRVQA
jgi:hypothetical protein